MEGQFESAPQGRSLGISAGEDGTIYRSIECAVTKIPKLLSALSPKFRNSKGVGYRIWRLIVFAMRLEDDFGSLFRI
jgi:hypothetical protein